MKDGADKLNCTTLVAANLKPPAAGTAVSLSAMETSFSENLKQLEDKGVSVS